MINPVNDEASRLSYAIGLKELAPFLRRMLQCEATVATQAVQILALQTAVLQLKHPKHVEQDVRKLELLLEANGIFERAVSDAS
jgi:hypothetical protein